MPGVDSASDDDLEALVAEAIEHGSRDNVTAVVVAVR